MQRKVREKNVGKNGRFLMLARMVQANHKYLATEILSL